MLYCCLGIMFMVFSVHGLFAGFEPTGILAGICAGAFSFGVFIYERKEKQKDASFKKEIEKDLSQHSNKQERLEYWEEIFRKNPSIWSPINDEKCRKERDIHNRRYKSILKMLTAEKNKGTK